MGKRIALTANELQVGKVKSAAEDLDAAYSKLQSVYAEAILAVDFADADTHLFKGLEDDCAQILKLIRRSASELDKLATLMKTGPSQLEEVDERFKNELEPKSMNEWLQEAKNSQLGDVFKKIKPIADILIPSTGAIFDTLYYVATSPTRGYEISDDKTAITAWGKKYNREWEDQAGTGSVNAYIGKVEASAKSDFTFMEAKAKREYKDGEWTDAENMTFVNAEVGASVGVSSFAFDAEIETGDDMLGAKAETEGALLSGNLEAKGQFSIGEDGVDLNVKGEAMVAAAEGEVSGMINILGLEIKVSAGGYAGAVGVEGKLGIDDNSFVVEGGAAALLGISFGLEIGFNDTGWKNALDAVVFWD